MTENVHQDGTIGKMIVKARILCRYRWRDAFYCGQDVIMMAVGKDHRMPESFNAFCNIVSLTAAKTSLMFEVSVACVRLRVG